VTSLGRRDFLKGGAAAGALLLGRPLAALATGEGALDAWGTPRTSRLFPQGTFLAHADLHNHTLLSDGAGRAEDAFAMMRAAGIDVAALTDHAVAGKVGGQVTCAHGGCTAVVGINEDSWQTLAALADGADAAGSFVAMRGFEWTTPALGHVNVWFSETWVDALTTNSLTDFRGAAELSRMSPALGPELTASLLPILGSLPQVASIDAFWDWLAASPGSSPLGGGGDGLAGLNHPNEYGNFNDFQYFGEVADRVVSCEVLNLHDDYFFRGVDDGMPNPINRCLNAGWRVGMLGVTDEHGDSFDIADGKGRAGLWVRSLTRDGVREALEARRFYATRRQGLRLDASATPAGGPVARMGSTLVHRRGSVRFELDIDRGPAWYGKPLLVQVLRPGLDDPEVARVAEVRVPRPDEAVLAIEVDVDLDAGPWVLLRVSDPEAPAHPSARGDFAAFGDAVAYASPFFLAADAPSPSAVDPPGPPVATSPSAAVGSLPATGARGPVGWAAAAAGAALLARHLTRTAGPVGPTVHGHAHAHGAAREHEQPHEHEHAVDPRAITSPSPDVRGR
jgi:hypothetical protein